MLSCIQLFFRIQKKTKLSRPAGVKWALRGSISGPGEIRKGIKNRPFEHRSAFGAPKMPSRGRVWKKHEKTKKNRPGNESPWRWEQKESMPKRVPKVIQNRPKWAMEPHRVDLFIIFIDFRRSRKNMTFRRRPGEVQKSKKSTP